MAPEQRAILISIRPRFARAIVDGTKTIELRRGRMLVAAGGLLVLYSSSPVKAVVATAILHKVEEATPQQMWPRVRRGAGVVREEYDRYFRNTQRAFALHLRDVIEIHVPYTLAEMRMSPRIAPPQSFRYITAAEAEVLTRGKAVAANPVQSRATEPR